jgi:hypothetical protein
VEFDSQHFRHAQHVWAARHGDGHVEASRAHGQHAHAATGRGVAIGAEQRLAGNGETLQVDLMADAIAGPRIEDAVLGGDVLQIGMIVSVTKIGL